MYRKVYTVLITKSYTDFEKYRLLFAHTQKVYIKEELDMSERKKDHRAVVTGMMIKDALLTLLHETEYDKITVTALCRTAGITRATFYLHYQNLDEVLDEVLDDALRLTEIDPAFGRLESSHDAYFKAKQAEYHDIDTFLPACQRAASDPKYRVLFLNESMSHIILDKLYRKERAIRIPDIMAAHELSEWEADVIFRYMLYGNFAVNKALAWIKNDDWYHAQDVIRKFTAPTKYR